MFRFLFLDLDDTILDFHKAESIAIAKAFRSVGVEPTEALITRYSQVNKMHWQMLERGELTREEVLVQRFSYLFRELGLDADPQTCQKNYEDFLCIGHYFIEGAEELLPWLASRFQLYLASNGTAKVQAARLKSSGIGPYFTEIFISQEIGFNKPSAEYFKRCFSRIPNFDPNEAIIIGDSLTSDIKGGNNAGIHTCWFNPSAQPRNPEIPCDYEIRSLSELKDILL